MLRCTAIAFDASYCPLGIQYALLYGSFNPFRMAPAQGRHAHIETCNQLYYLYVYASKLDADMQYVTPQWTNCTIALLLQSACFVRMYDKRIARHCRLRADLYSQPLIITTIADAEDVDGIAVIVSVLRQCRILNMIFLFLNLRL